MSSLPPQSAPPRCDSPVRASSSRHRVDTATATARPFTASAARSSGLLAVHVHGGEHLDALAATAPSTFVVASVSAHSGSGDCVVCWSSAAERSGDVDASDASDACDVLYMPRYSPFAATRVVERSATPAWNELLALALPLEWRGRSGKDDGDGAQTPLPLVLTLELVQRGASQQEDFLLATARVPLRCVASHLQQVRLALQFPSATTAATPRIFVSLRELTCDGRSDGADRFELLIERYVPVDTNSDVEALTVAAAVASPGTTLLHKHEQLAQLFTAAEHEQPLGIAMVNGVAAAVGVTPFARRRPVSSDGDDTAFAWHFPLAFTLAAVGANDPQAPELELALFDAAGKRVGAGRSVLSHELRVRGVSTAVTAATFAPLPPVPIFAESAHGVMVPNVTAMLLGHVHVHVRWWSAAAWTAFARAAPSRRVVRSNRSVGRTGALLALEWIGALLRGLNRYPVSSFCDDGGLGSVLARFLAAASPSSDAAQTETVATAGNTRVDAVLVAQLAHLQAESAAQRQQIERLQTELDARLRAVQTCGKELVVLRREVRAKDELVRDLRAERDQASARESEQIAHIAAAAAVPPTSSSSSSSNSVSAVRTHEQLALVVAKYRALEQQHRETRTQLDAATHALELARGLETRYNELEHAHLVQAAHVQRLQRDKQLVAELKRTVRLQETVIRQFEAAVGREATQELANSRVRAPSHPVATTTRTTRAMALTSNSNSNSNNSNRTPVAAADANSPMTAADALLAVRVRVLEEQLATNARAATSEIGRLRRRVLELETARND